MDMLQYDSALRLFETSRDAGGSSGLYETWAVCLWQLGRDEEAREIFDLAGNDWWSWLVRGKFELDRGNAHLAHHSACRAVTISGGEASEALGFWADVMERLDVKADTVEGVRDRARLVAWTETEERAEGGDGRDYPLKRRGKDEFWDVEDRWGLNDLSI